MMGKKCKIHCWHDTGKIKYKDNLKVEKICCHCGKKKMMDFSTVVEIVKHGKYEPDRTMFKVSQNWE